jgi:hypothetical protein
MNDLRDATCKMAASPSLTTSCAKLRFEITRLSGVAPDINYCNDLWQISVVALRVHDTGTR